MLRVQSHVFVSPLWISVDAIIFRIVLRSHRPGSGQTHLTDRLSFSEGVAKQGGWMLYMAWQWFCFRNISFQKLQHQPANELLRRGHWNKTGKNMLNMMLIKWWKVLKIQRSLMSDEDAQSLMFFLKRVNQILKTSSLGNELNSLVNRGANLWITPNPYSHYIRFRPKLNSMLFFL